jgi:hypothetical protein
MSLAPEFNPAVPEIRRIAGLPDGFFNAAAWGDGDTTMLLGRHVRERGKPGDPDVGGMVLATLQNGEVASLADVWTPETGTQGDLLEDARAVVSPDGGLFLGWTRLSPNHKGYEPYPAFSLTTTNALQGGEFPLTHHIIDMTGADRSPAVLGDPNRLYLSQGKNATPLGNNRFLFRPETEDHGFLVFSINEGGGAEEQQRLVLSPQAVPEWASRRIGSTMPPVWLNEREAVLLIHGIRMDGAKYVYSIGSARLFLDDNKHFWIDNISPEPHLTPDSFTDIFPGEQVELRPEERQAVYLCGGVAVYDDHGQTPRYIKTYPNVGDTRTVEATFSVDTILQGWDRTEPSAKSLAQRSY